jgi:ATP-dependent helicase/nuclease subunit A
VAKQKGGEGAQTDLFGGAAESSPRVRPTAAKPGGTRERASPATGAAPSLFLPDQPARDRINGDLETSLLVEAGAGAGKTTEMVNRMLALVDAGVRVERIAAVTFTRKAAAELRERFQNALERALREEPEEDRRVRLDSALRSIDRSFLGTIHAFCARLLRERPLDAGLDPGFREVFGADEKRLRRRYWSTHIERAAAAGDAALATLQRVALTPAQIYPLFERLVENPDVTYPAESIPRPDASAARAALEPLLERAITILPRQEPDRGWDRLQAMIRQLRFHRTMGWADDVVFLDVLAQTFSRTPKIEVQYKYDGVPGGRAAAQEIERQFRAFIAEDGPGGMALAQWRAHRYPIALSFAHDAADAFAVERRRAGTLFFTDLLVLAARLLRENPAARRELGERYRHLLIDEFQDTDPLQAEVLLLLAAEPVAASDDWRDVVPRPGALFVVGDPKQSIYRFRRADIALYGQVKQRFQAFGDVLELTANFRSRPPIEGLVNTVFAQRFPDVATPEQAPYSPMRVQRGDAAQQGVGWYRLSTKHRGDDDAAAEDAERLASWIAQRIARGERKPGEFLVLTRTKKFLAAYARALEARNIPVQVTGAGLGIETELSELLLLLEALSDPADATLTLAVLVGLFFGIDYEALAAHVLDQEGRISFTHVPDEPQTAVERALVQLNAWWRLARTEPADYVVARIVEEQGLLPHAAGGPLGESRAGALLFIVDAVARAAQEGDATLTGAIAAIEAALESEEAEAPLEPGRADVLRLMNLHQAKGLEAAVVVLAAPFGAWKPGVDHAIARTDEGGARGWTLIADRKEGWSRGTNIHAAPPDWEVHEAAERRFAAAEDDRLLYVAATRAREELWVGRPFEKDADSPWALLYPELEKIGPAQPLPLDEAPRRARLDRSADAIRADTASAAERRAILSTPTHRFAAVTTRVKVEPPPRETGRPAADAAPAVAGRGISWGIAVHGALEAAARGVSGEKLRSVCRGLLISAERPAAADGSPDELDELTGLVQAVVTSDLWKRASRAARAGRLLVEAPFALPVPADAFVSMMTRAGAPVPDTVAPVEIIEGVIDLAFRDEDGWTLVDYKSDAAGRGIEPWRRERYRAQLGLYAAAWERLTGQEIAARILLFTATGDMERW